MVQELQEVGLLGNQDAMITVDMLKDTTFLEAAVTESTRLYPSPTSPRLVMTPMEFGGYVVPQGSYLWLYRPLDQRNEKIFPQPDQFIPERHMGEKGSYFGYCFSPFGHGSHKCLGMKLAYMFIKLAIATIIQVCLICCCIH